MPENNEQVNSILDAFGGKVLDESGNDSGYRSPNQVKKAETTKALAGMLDAPEPKRHELELNENIGMKAKAEIGGQGNPILEEALVYIKDGKSVIPVGKNKRPLIGWKEFHTRIATEEEVRGWFEQWPDAQLGLVTGAISGLAVVDIEKEFGDYKKLNLPETMVSRTGSGGYHLFYQMVEGVRNRAKIDGQEIDIRGEGGYVIVPPSSNENGKYEWVEQIDVLPAFPVSVFEMEKPVMEGGGYEKRIDFDLMDFEGIGQGGRNDGMAQFIGSAVNIVHPNYWEALLWPMVLAANSRNEPPLPETEVRATWESITKREGDKPEAWAKWEEMKKAEQAVDELNKIEGDELVKISDLAKEIRASATPAISTGFSEFDIAMKGGFREGDLVIISGLTGQGKTSLGLTFTKALIKQSKSLLWLSYETPIDVIDDKLGDMGVEEGADIYTPRIMPSGSLLWVTKKVEEGIALGIKVVVVDLVDFLEPSTLKKNNSEALILRQITTELKNLARDKRIIIVLMAHVRKQANRKEALDLQDIAHSSSIAQLSDYVFIIERKEKKVKQDKQYDSDGQMILNKIEKAYTNYSSIHIRKNRYTGVLITVEALYENEEFIGSAPRELSEFLAEKQKPESKKRKVIGIDD